MKQVGHARRLMRRSAGSADRAVVYALDDSQRHSGLMCSAGRWDRLRAMIAVPDGYGRGGTRRNWRRVTAIVRRLAQARLGRRASATALSWSPSSTSDSARGRYPADHRGSSGDGRDHWRRGDPAGWSPLAGRCFPTWPQTLTHPRTFEGVDLHPVQETRIDKGTTTVSYNVIYCITTCYKMISHSAIGTPLRPAHTCAPMSNPSTNRNGG